MNSIKLLKGSQSKELRQKRSRGIVGLQRREPKVDRSNPWVPWDGSPAHRMDTELLGMSPPGDQWPHRVTADAPTVPTPSIHKHPLPPPLPPPPSAFVVLSTKCCAWEPRRSIRAAPTFPHPCGGIPCLGPGHTWKVWVLCCCSCAQMRRRLSRKPRLKRTNSRE